jgi:hypothetical protein
VRRAAAHDPPTPPNRKQTRAALPHSVRKGYAFLLMPLFFRGCASGDVEAQPQEFYDLIGTAEPFRTGRGKAAGRLRDPCRLSCRVDELVRKLDAVWSSEPTCETKTWGLGLWTWDS